MGQNDLAKFSTVLQSRANRSLLEGALTQGLDMQRFIKCAWIQASTNDDIRELAQKNPTSVFKAMLQCAQMGLYPDGVSGEAYLVKFGNSCVAIRGYKGLMKLFAANPVAAAMPFVVDVIRENDWWDWELGDKPTLMHKPAKTERGNITHYYAIARFRDGSVMPKVMSVDEVEVFKSFSKTKTFWDSKDEPTRTAMRLKTVVRQLIKTLPLSDSARESVEVEQQAEASGESYANVGMDVHIEGGDIKKTQPTTRDLGDPAYQPAPSLAVQESVAQASTPSFNETNEPSDQANGASDPFMPDDFGA